MLLWCAVTSPASLPQILREGLRVPSKDSPSTGYMFGKGIYFTDCFSKAAKASLIFRKAQRGDTVRSFVLLCEVAAGDMHRAYSPHQFLKPP
jgi:hypothetical protein